MNNNFSQVNNSKIIIGKIKKKLSGFLLWIKNSRFDEQLTSHLQEIYSSYERELEELQKKYEVQESKLYLFSDEKSYLVELSLFLERLTSELEGYFYYDRFPKAEQGKSKINFHSQSYETLLDYLHHFLELDIKDALWKSYFSDYIATKLYDFTQENFDPVETNQFYEELPDVFQQFFDKYFLLEVKKQLDTPPVLDYLKVHSIFDLSFDANLLNQLQKKIIVSNNETKKKPITFSFTSDEEKGFKRYPLTTLEQLIIEEDWSEKEIRDFVEKYYDDGKVPPTPFAFFNPSEDIFFSYFSTVLERTSLVSERDWHDYLWIADSCFYFKNDLSCRIYFYGLWQNNQLVFGIRPILKIPEKEFTSFIDSFGIVYNSIEDNFGYSYDYFYPYAPRPFIAGSKPNRVFYGEYPQFISSCTDFSILDESKLTGKIYTCFGTDSQTIFLLPEYELTQDPQFQKYCLLQIGSSSYRINVSPIEWFIDYDHNLLISKYVLFNGVTTTELAIRNQSDLTREMFIQKINPLIQARLEQFSLDLVPEQYIQDRKGLTNEKINCLKKRGFIDGKL